MSMTSGVLRTETFSTSYREFSEYTYVNDTNAENSSYKFTFFDNPHNNFSIVSYEIDSLSLEEIYPTTFTFEQTIVRVLAKIFRGTLLLDSDLSNENTWFAATTSAFLGCLNTSTNISKTMDRIAAAMLNRLRDMSNITISSQSGSMELYIRVSWWWLLLPSSTVVFGTILLISTIITTRKHKLPIWKASELALLFHGLDLSSLSGDSAEMLKASEMKDIASALRVRFGRDLERGGVLKLERMPRWSK